MNPELPIIAKLTEVSLQTGWPDEAKHFTPWLFDNLERLGEAVGLELEPIEAECRVGRYAADIVAKDLKTARTVLIENQLFAGDHGHLGQLITYWAGLKADVSIWIARDFTEPHLRALDRLNRMTPEGVSFHAVRLRLVTIAGSPPAAIFEPVALPSWEDKEPDPGAPKPAGPGNPIAAGRYEFWEAYRKRHPEEESSRRVGHSVSWRLVKGGPLVLSRYVAKHRVGIFARGATESDAYVKERLRLLEEQLKDELGVLAGRQEPYIKFLPIDTTDPARWPQAIDWLEAETQRYQAAIAPYFPSELPPSE